MANASPGRGAAGLAQCLEEQILDLPVHAAQVVRRPLLERFVDCRVEAEEKSLLQDAAQAYRVPVLTIGWVA